MKLALLVILAACQGPDKPIEEEKRPALAPRPTLDQETAMARWRQLAPTGLTYGDAIDKIPRSQRAAMAFALVRDGHLQCTRMASECGQPFIDGPTDDEGLDAPCLRRRIVEYMFAGADRIDVPADVRTAIATSHDADLLQVVANTLDDQTIVDFLVEAEAAGTPSPFGALSGRPRAVVIDAARRHVDEGANDLDVGTDPELVIAAIADREIAADVRSQLVGAFEHSSPALVAALEAAAGDPDCRLSARAAEQLAAIAGDTRFLPRPPVKHDPEAYFREVCRLVGGDFFLDETLAPSFAPKGGIVVVAPRGEPYADNTKPARRTVTADEDLVPFLRGLVNGACDAKTCAGAATRYELAWSGNVLARVTVHRDLAKEKAEQAKADAADCRMDGD